MSRAMYAVVPLLAAALLVLSCDDTDKVFKSSGNEESKPPATLLGQLKNTSNAVNANTAVPQTVASVIYLIEVRTETAGLCTGEFSAEILSNFSFKLPNSRIQCVGLTIDLASLLNGGNVTGVPASGQSGTTADSLAGISHDGYILSLKQLAGANFDPPRPLLLGPVFQNIDKFAGFNREITSHLTAESAGQRYDAMGRFHVSVINNKETYSNAAIKDKTPLDKIVHWKMTVEGFDGVPSTVGVLMPSIEFKWNTRPIMVPYVQIKGNLKGFLTGDAAMLEKAAGLITATLIVKDFRATE